MKIVSVCNSKSVRPEDNSFTSFRMLTEKDGMGFGVCKTVIPKGGPHHWHYKKHLEACYCISGHGILKSLDTGDQYEITPDTMYVLDSHDDHVFTAFTDVILISIFNPPLKGNEVHGKDGSYE